MDQKGSARGCQPWPESDLKPPAPSRFARAQQGRQPRAQSGAPRWPACSRGRQKATRYLHVCTPLSHRYARACGAAEFARRIRAAPIHPPLEHLTYSIGMSARSSTSRADGISLQNLMVPLRCPLKDSRAASFTGRGKGSPASRPSAVRPRPRGRAPSSARRPAHAAAPAPSAPPAHWLG